jgi:hypothetical protein
MLRTYRLIGGEGGMELEQQFYLSVPHGGWNDRTLQGRRLLTQLRCGNSQLRINTGRWEGLEREERLCELCAEETEDEAHFLLRCPLFAAEREKLFSQIAAVCEENSAGRGGNVGSAPLRLSELSAETQLRILLGGPHPSLQEEKVHRRVLSRVLVAVAEWTGERRTRLKAVEQLLQGAEARETSESESESEEYDTSDEEEEPEQRE